MDGSVVQAVVMGDGGEPRRCVCGALNARLGVPFGASAKGNRTEL